MDTGADPDRAHSRYGSTQTPRNTQTAVWFGITLALAIPVVVLVMWFVLPRIWGNVEFFLAAFALAIVVGSAALFRPWEAL